LAYPHGVSMARFARKLRTLRISHTSIYILSLNSCLPRQGAPAAMPPPLRVSACWRPLAIKMRRCNIRTCACLEGMLYTSIYSKPAHALRATDALLRLLRRGSESVLKFFSWILKHGFFGRAIVEDVHRRDQREPWLSAPHLCTTSRAPASFAAPAAQSPVRGPRPGMLPPSSLASCIVPPSEEEGEEGTVRE